MRLIDRMLARTARDGQVADTISCSRYPSLPFDHDEVAARCSVREPDSLVQRTCDGRVEGVARPSNPCGPRHGQERREEGPDLRSRERNHDIDVQRARDAHRVTRSPTVRAVLWRRNRRRRSLGRIASGRNSIGESNTVLPTRWVEIENAQPVTVQDLSARLRVDGTATTSIPAYSGRTWHDGLKSP